MKKLTTLLLAMALILLTGSFFAPAQPQNLANEEKPTFYRLVPGTYVNGWPRFTIHYPRDWVERRTPPQEIFRASVPGSFPFPAFMVAVAHNPDPLEKMAATLCHGIQNDVHRRGPRQWQAGSVEGWQPGPGD
jgi:hypothetical protein